MATEIERKYLVKDLSVLEGAKSYHVKHGYLNGFGQSNTTRVSIKNESNSAILNVKGPTHGISRAEFEYAIPYEDALSLMSLAQSTISKRRYLIPIGDLVWEVDVFDALNEGLIMAEVELPGAEVEVPLPDWIGKEVTHDNYYYNLNLSNNPFTMWAVSELEIHHRAGQ